jgi:hypothetical protein
VITAGAAIPFTSASQANCSASNFSQRVKVQYRRLEQFILKTMARVKPGDNSECLSASAHPRIV